VVTKKKETSRIPGKSAAAETQQTVAASFPFVGLDALARRTCLAASISTIFSAGSTSTLAATVHFEGFFHRRRKGPARGANIEVELSIPLE